MEHKRKVNQFAFALLIMSYIISIGLVAGFISTFFIERLIQWQIILGICIPFSLLPINIMTKNIYVKEELQ